MTRTSIARVVGPLMAAAWVAAACASPAGAQDTLPPFDRVEEDWELVIDQPDLLSEGPQITTAMSPTGDTADQFVAFNLNYRSHPSFRPGGLEVVAYDGERVLDTSAQRSDRLATQGESISWTQAMTLSGGSLIFEIIGGHSTTWGQFGQGSGANLNVQVAMPLGSLAAYKPDASVAYSGPGWQSNRVSSMRLVRVKYYAAGALVAVDEEPRSVDLDR